MTLWILDTDHISLLQRGHPVVINKVAAVNPSEILSNEQNPNKN
jgi:tRNA(fMet)-specific endonuclease VapC